MDKQSCRHLLVYYLLDISRIAGITRGNASNNKKAFKDHTWIPCFTHNLHLAVNKAINIDRESAAPLRLQKTISAFTRMKKKGSPLAREMKGLIQEYLKQRNDVRELQLLLNTATYLDPWFKDSFVFYLRMMSNKVFWYK